MIRSPYEEVQSRLRPLLWERFPEFSFEVTGYRNFVTFSHSSSATYASEYHGQYGDANFVFRAFRDPKLGYVSLRCVGLWQNWLADSRWSLERDAEIRSRILYSEELIHILEGLR